VLTDQISELLFTSEQGAKRNLAREGIPAAKVFFVGNVMIDSLRDALPRAVPPERLFECHGSAAFRRGPCGSDPASARLRGRSRGFAGVLSTFGAIAQRLPVVLPLRPRTVKAIEQHGLTPLLDRPGLLAVPPQPYLVMVGLIKGATVVLTDSGGI
jgi:UDP-N-acetylglucosamine 2-epimerase (non-hydrolysing)